jgi:Protein of unknown function (DUF2917)
MNIGFNRVELHLKPREVLRVYEPQGARVECVRGGLWITQDRDFEDHFLSADDTIVLDRRGLALIHAQESSDIVLLEPAPRPSLRERLARWIGRTFGPESIDRSQPIHRLRTL